MLKSTLKGFISWQKPYAAPGCNSVACGLLMLPLYLGESAFLTYTGDLHSSGTVFLCVDFFPHCVTVLHLQGSLLGADSSISHFWNKYSLQLLALPIPGERSSSNKGSQVGLKQPCRGPSAYPPIPSQCKLNSLEYQLWDPGICFLCDSSPLVRHRQE